MTIDVSQQTPARDWLLLALLWLIHALATLLWLRLDNRFPVGDAAIELTRALAVADALGRPSLDVFSRVVAASAGQPPLPYLATAPLVWLAGRGPDPATLINLTWLALLMASVYSLTRRLFPVTSDPFNPLPKSVNSSPVALAAAALVSLYPWVVLYTRLYNPALTVTALGALAIWLLVESDGLHRWLRPGRGCGAAGQRHLLGRRARSNPPHSRSGAPHPSTGARLASYPQPQRPGSLRPPPTPGPGPCQPAKLATFPTRAPCWTTR